MSLDPSFKTKWVAALRSGLYPQCRGGISSGGSFTSYCCIGVAGVINGGNRLGDNWTTGAVAEKIGLSQGEKDTLVQQNDSLRKSFIEIADYIEEHL